MREIKFRAWEKNLKEIIPVHNIDFEKRMINTESAWRLFDEIELMQSTGLKDKNGKEIYEGDILKVPDLYETPENTYTTYHHEKVIHENYGFGTDNAMFYEDGDYISEECEVVGNIYENPKLLGENK